MTPNPETTQAEALSVPHGWAPIEQLPVNEKSQYDFCLIAWGPDDDKNTGFGMRFGDEWFASATFYNGAPHDKRQLEIREVKVLPTHYMPFPVFSDMPNTHMVEFCDGATTYKNLTPGRYRREWAGYSVAVWIHRLGDGSLVEIAPSHMHSDPASMPDAKWFPLPNTPREPDAQN